MDRRKFVASVAVSAAATSTATPSALAAQGGSPVRDKPLRGDNWGPLYYDSAEKMQVDEVVDTGVPFRFSGRRGVAPDHPEQAAGDDYQEHQQHRRGADPGGRIVRVECRGRV